MSENFKLVMLSADKWEAIEQRLNEISDLVLKRNIDDRNSEWVESETARKTLNVSRKTWQTYRDERRIPFSQFGRKIYVRRKDLNQFLENHLIG